MSSATLSWSSSSKPEADDGEVYGCAIGGQGHDPAALAATLITDTGRSPARKPTCLSHRRNGIVRQHIEILRVDATGASRAALVVDEGADSLCREQPLQYVEIERGIVFRSVHEDNHRHLARAFRQHEAAFQLHTRVTDESRVPDIEGDALAG